MAILLTNGNFYIKHSNTGAVLKTGDINEAQDFYTAENAIKQIQKAHTKCAGYYYINTETGEIQRKGNYLITDGKNYIYLNETGHHRKTADRRCALKYDTLDEAIKYMIHAPKKTEGFYVSDDSNRVLYRNEDIQSNKKRKHYSKNVRKMIYDKSDGRCMLCGRKILFSDMTLDHIMPLGMGGADAVENLQTAHLYCNHFKADILPDEFVERITEIFLYQIGKKYGNELKWEMIQLLMNCAENR